MKPLSSVISGLSLTLALAAQTDPVGTWIVRPYGGESIPASTQLSALVAVNANQTLDLQVNGVPGALVGIIAGSQEASIPVLSGALLVQPAFPVLPARLDESGQLALSFPLKSITTNALYLQMFTVTGQSVQMSLGYEVMLWSSGLLTYTGPALSAVVQVFESQPPQYSVDVTVQAPTTGWTLRLDSTQVVDGISEVYVTLEQPGAGEITLPTVTDVLLSVPLGTAPGYAVKVLVAQEQRGVQYFVAPPHDFAAILNTF